MEQIGPYRLLEEVARGGMGIVHRALAPDGRQVALKVLLAGRSASATQKKRFLLEVRALQKLDHPHVVRMLEAGEAYGCPWLALQWIEGGSLAERVARAGPLPPGEAADLVRKLAGALAHCHARGVLHRDLSPKNVLLRRADGQPLLTDFGLSREVIASLSQSRPTVEGQLMGTPGFWSPEQAHGEMGQIGPGTDVWGLGALLYYCLTGTGPIAGASLGDLALALLREIPAPSSLRPGIPRELDAVCLSCLRKEPAERPADPAAVERALLRLVPTAPSAEARGSTGPAVAAVLAAAAVCAWLLLSPRAPATPPVNPAVPASAAVATAEPEPPDPELERLRAQLEEAVGRQDGNGALAALDEIEARQGPTAGSCADRGLILLLAQLPREALPHFDRAIDGFPGPVHPSWLSNRASTREQLGDLAGALADHERAAALAPLTADMHYNRAVLLARLGRIDEALRAYGRAIELAPADVDYLLNRGNVLYDRGDFAAALRDYERALEVGLPEERAAPVRRTVAELRAR